MSNNNLATLEFVDNSPKVVERVDTQTHVKSDSNNFRGSIHGFGSECKKLEASNDFIHSPLKDE